MSGAALRYQILPEGEVFVSLSPGGGGRAPATARLSEAAVKAFAWGVLSDLDPFEAKRRGAPAEYVGFSVPTEARPRPGRSLPCGLPPSSFAALQATPDATSVLGATSVAIAERAGCERGTVVAAMSTMRREGLVAIAGGQRGQGGGYRYRRTAAGDALVASGGAR